MTEPPIHPRAQPPVRTYVDGGRALVTAPYDRVGWRAVQEGWWWHLAAMVVFPPYAIVALTVWQRPSGQPLARRVLWSLLATLGALLLVGVWGFLVFSRRWYWWHRGRVAVDDVAVAAPSGGSVAHRSASAGRALVDRATSAGRARLRWGMPLEWLPAPWGQLRDEVGIAAVRVAEARPHAEGPAVEVAGRAADELRATFRTACSTATRAVGAARSLEVVDRAQIEADLRELAASPGDAADLDAAWRALDAQRAAAERMASTLAGTEGRLRRLAAQAGEVAARAEELVWAPAPAARRARGLDEVTDQLAAIRRALGELEQLEQTAVGGA